jgi:hypothetical protein
VENQSWQRRGRGAWPLADIPAALRCKCPGGQCSAAGGPLADSVELRRALTL